MKTLMGLYAYLFENSKAWRSMEGVLSGAGHRIYLEAVPGGLLRFLRMEITIHTN